MAVITSQDPQDSRKSSHLNEPIVNSWAALNDEEQLRLLRCYYYNHLKTSELEIRPNMFYLENIQSNINSDYREELINRLVLLSEELEVVPETIYSTVGYLDRYLSGPIIQDIEEFLLVGLTCFIIAAKYEQASHPCIQDIFQVFYNLLQEDFGVVEFEKEQVLNMERGVLRFLNYELTTPLAIDFLQLFVNAEIQEEMKGDDDARTLRFRCLTNYISELSLLDYTMIRFSPSVVAASAVFLGKFILSPHENPWSSSLKNVTEYDAWNLKDCIEKLHLLYLENYKDVGDSAIKKKYSKREYSFVANMCCPEFIPQHFFY